MKAAVEAHDQPAMAWTIIHADWFLRWANFRIYELSEDESEKDLE